MQSEDSCVRYLIELGYTPKLMFHDSFVVVIPRPGLRPIQPIRPRMAPRFEGPRTSEIKENALLELSSCQTTVMLDRLNCV